MSIYKQITSENVSTSEVEIFKTRTLDSSSISTLYYRFYPNAFETLNTLQQDEQSNRDSLISNFYLSGSVYSESESRFNAPYFKKGPEYNSTNPQYFNKFHTGSTSRVGTIFSIPQEYFGQYIKPGTFSLTDKTHTYPINIVDDKYGNLYSTNAHKSQSGVTSISSSDNYIGNIFYRTGVAVITAGHEQFSGSKTYHNIGTNYSMSFDSSKDIYVTEYSLTIEPNEFNKTNNPTAKLGMTGSSAGFLDTHLTSSNWSPYFNTVGFYDDKNMLVAKATYPQYIKTRKDIPIILKIKMDW